MTERLSVPDVQAWLAPHGLSVQELPSDTSTATLAAESLGTTVERIVKSLVFMVSRRQREPALPNGQKEGAVDEPILMLAPGDKTVNTSQLAELLNVESARLARPNEVVSLTGYEVGGVPPIAHKRHLRTFLERALLAHPAVYAAAGSRNAVFAVDPDRLVELTNAEVVEVAE